jgi:hypothetical protein
MEQKSDKSHKTCSFDYSFLLEHYPSHIDLLPDSSSDFEYNNNASSSNDGLELYMEDGPDD